MSEKEFVVIVASVNEIENTLAEHNAIWFDEALGRFGCECGIGRFAWIRL